MATVAKVTLVGNLGRDPETRYTPSGTLNVQFSLATNRRWTDASGQQQERTTWFRVTMWGKRAETLVQLVEQGYLVKGRQVFVSGSLETHEYQDQNNQTRTSIDVTADEVLLLGGRQDGDGGGPRQSSGGSSGGEDFGASSDIEDVPF